MQTIKQIVLCALCAFAFGACESDDSSVDSTNSRDLSQTLIESKSNESTSNPTSPDEVYLGEKPLQIISDKIDFWGRAFS